MLQNLGLIRYNNRYFLDNKINPIYSPKSNRISNFFSSNQKNNTNNKRNNSCKEKKNLSLNKKNINKREDYTKKIDEIFINNLNKFISESSHNVEKKNIPLSLVKINHDIHNNNSEKNNFFMTFGPNNYSKKNKMKKKSQKLKNEINKNIKLDIENKNKNINDNNINKYDIDREIFQKNNKIKQLIINNDSMLNKIQLLKDEYNNNLKNRSEMDKNLNSNLHNSKNLKFDKNFIDNDLSYLKENIIELKNKILMLNKEQSSLNLMLFKEKMENDLNKEDIVKMNKLIEGLNKDIKTIKNEISLIRNKNKKLQMEQTNLSSDKKQVK